MAIRLTESSIRAALTRVAESKKREELLDAGEPGLRFRASPGNIGRWTLLCRDQASVQKRIVLGEFPEIGVSEARDLARQTRHKIRHEGVDPNKEKKEKRRAAKLGVDPASTLDAIIKTYGEKVGAARKSWYDADQRMRLIFKPLIGREARLITRFDSST